MPLKKHLYFLVLTLICYFFFTPLQAQDPFFTHFLNAESQFNPALVGYRGAVSVGTKYKTQWFKTEIPAYQSIYASYEESMPCSVLDYGFSISKDTEGAGLLETIQFGGQVAGVFSYRNINLRLGAGVQWGQKRIDYSRLTFSDQLDPKYGFSDAAGVANISSFTAPNMGESLWYFAPSLGFSLQSLLGGGKSSLQFGGALHNAYALVKKANKGSIASILDIGTFLPERITAFGSYEWIFYSNRHNFASIKPIVFYQKQSSIDVITAGAKFSYNRNVAVGLYAQINEKQADGVNTNWLTVALDFGGMIRKYQRIDLGIAYSSNFRGLRNAFGPILEFSAVLHFGKSPICRAFNLDNDLTQKGINCEMFKITNGKIYEDIWYKNN